MVAKTQGTTEEVLAVLFRQVAELGTTLVMVTHEHTLVDRFDTVIDFAQFTTPAAPGDGGDAA